MQRLFTPFVHSNMETTLEYGKKKVFQTRKSISFSPNLSQSDLKNLTNPKSENAKSEMSSNGFVIHHVKLKLVFSHPKAKHMKAAQMILQYVKNCPS